MASFKVTKVKQDLFWASFSHLFQKAAGYCVLVLLARYLDKENLGQFLFTATLASFFALPTELGTNRYLIREIAGKPDRALGFFSEVLSLRLPFLLLAFVIMNGLVAVWKPDILPISLFMSVQALIEDLYYSFSALFLGLKRVGFTVVSMVGSRICLVGLVFLAVKLNASLQAISLCYVAGNVILLGTAVVLVWQRIGPFALHWDLSRAREILRFSFPFFLLTVLSLMHLKVDTLMLGIISSYAAVAAYEVAFRLLEVSRFFIRPVSMVYYPLYSEMAGCQDWQGISSLRRKMLHYALFLGAAVTVAVLLAAPFAIRAVYGSNYETSIIVLRVLYLCVPALYVSMVTMILSAAIHTEAVAAKVMSIGVGINVLLNCISIPAWGAMGAAWTTVISETILALWLVRLTQRHVRSLSTGRSSIWAIPQPVEIGEHEGTL
jgi:O-antigen/teichoic acid export membrane protein